MLKEQFVHGLSMELVDLVDSTTLSEITTRISAYINQYQITKECTDLAVVEDFPEALKCYLVTRKIEGMADSSLELYKSTLVDFFRRVQKPIEDIKTNDIRTYLYVLQKERGLSNRTLRNRQAMVAAFFEWCANEEYISRNPCRSVRPIKYTVEPREPLNGIEMELLRSVCENARDRAMVEFFYSTGCRVSEMVHLKMKDISFENKEVTLFGKGSKYRTSYMNAKCEVALRSYLKEKTASSDGSVFSSYRMPYAGLGKRAIENRIRDLGEKAGIQGSVFPHRLRHTTATDSLNRGMDITEVQRLLGHSNINTTLVYAKVDAEKTKHDHMRCM